MKTSTSASDSGNDRHRVVFVFAGQGAQWPGMGRELLRNEAVFAAALSECDELVRSLSGFSVLDELTRPAGSGRLHEIDVLQPVMVSLQISMARMWAAWGLVPDAVVGHSMGEISAAHVCGALSLRDALLLAGRRSSLLRRISGTGALAVTELSAAEAGVLAAAGEGRIALAGHNSPRSTVLAGDLAALGVLVTELERDDVFGQLIGNTVPSHSHYVEPLRADLDQALRDLRPMPHRVPLYSTVTAAPVEGTELSGPYWMRNLRETVRVSETVLRLRQDGHDVFVEISTHPVLLSSVRRTLQHHELTATGLPTGRREQERESVQATRAALRDLGLGGSVPPAPALKDYRDAVLAAVRRPRPDSAGTA